MAALLSSCGKTQPYSTANSLEQLLHASETGTGTVRDQSNATLSLAEFAPTEPRAFQRVLENLNSESEFVRGGAIGAIAKIYLSSPQSHASIADAIGKMDSPRKADIAKQWSQWAVPDQKAQLHKFASTFDPLTRRNQIRSSAYASHVKDFGFGLQIGSRRSEVLEVLGTPWQDSPETIGYCDNPEGCPDLLFKFKGGKIIEAQW